MAARLSVKQDYESLLDKYDTWLFDCDGVLWSGDTLIEGATEVLQLLRTHSASSLRARSSHSIRLKPSYAREVGTVRHEQRNQVEEELQEEVRRAWC